MRTASNDRILDFGPMGMWWEITKSTADTGGEFANQDTLLGELFVFISLPTSRRFSCGLLLAFW